MAKTYATRVFEQFASEKDASTLKDFSNNDLTLVCRRTLPKRAGDFPGMEKTSLKVTLTDPATGQLVGISELSTSILVGTADASRDLLRDIVVEAAGTADYTNLINDQRLLSA